MGEFRFLFSSRRRHTRLVSDWSSDVCSSDLCIEPPIISVPGTEMMGGSMQPANAVTLVAHRLDSLWQRLVATLGIHKIGRASCRERVEIPGVTGCSKENIKTTRGNMRGTART